MKFDAYGVGERHAQRFIPSSPPVVLLDLIIGKERPGPERAVRDATTQPRPYRPEGIPLWHGSASSTESTELAARWGDPLFSANGFHPLEMYAGLIRHYRERWAAYGRFGHELSGTSLEVPGLPEHETGRPSRHSSQR